MKIPTWTSTFVLASVAALLTIACTKLPEPATATAPIKEVSGPVEGIADGDVTEHVKMALQQNESLKTFDISVITLKGDVRLIGVLKNQGQIDEAIKIASSAAGAHSIHNELTLQK